MANANLALLTTSNTFLDWMITTNNEANTINELRNGNFYKDGGNFTVANGTIIGLTTTGTGLQIGANSILGGLTTMNTSLHTGVATFSSNVSMTANLSVSANIANVGNVLVTQNIATGNAAVTQNTSTGNLSVTQNTTTGNLTVTTLLNISGNIIVGNVSATNANLPNINFDNAGNYSQNNGNLIINNLTVKGNTTQTGNTTTASDTFQLRTGLSSDGDGHFEVWRGSTISANAQVKFNKTSNVMQFAANDSQTFVTMLTTANVVDGFTSNSTTSTISANAAQTAYNVALSSYAAANSGANTVRISQNGASTLNQKQLNFVNTANVTIVVTDNGDGNANIAISSSAGQPPGGSDKQIQFNDSTVFNGSANVIYAKANGQMVVNNQTMTANLTFATGANAVSPTLVATREVVSNLANINNPNTATINLSVSNNWDLTTANTGSGVINVTFASWANSGNLQTCTMIVRQPGAAANTAQSSANLVNFTNANVIWSNGEVPVLAAFVGKMDILTFITTDGGVHVYGAHSMANVG
jgi:hypothetical protein